MELIDQITATCPACGLMCDDITINTTSSEIDKTCIKSVNFFQKSLSTTATSAQIKGQNSTLSEAIDAAAAIFNRSQQPLFAGLGTEVYGMRALIDLAKKADATLDHMHSEGTVNNTLTLQNIGYQTTTMTEVRNRADLILIIGTALSDSHPRFFEKLVWNKDSLFDKPTPEIIYLGLPSGTKSEQLQTSMSPDGKKPTVVGAEPGQLPELINTLNQLVNAKSNIHNKDDDIEIAGVSIKTLKAIVSKLQAAQYGVVVWSTSSLKLIKHSELTIQSIVKFINKLNETNRVAGLPLNSGDGDTTVNNTSAWVTGYATRNRFIDGHPSFDARQFSTKKQLLEADSLLWVSTFNDIPPPKTAAPTIVIGHPDTTFKTPPDVFIPVAIPGVHAKGLMFRMDSSVTLPLKKIQDSELPTLAKVLNNIESLLA